MMETTVKNTTDIVIQDIPDCVLELSNSETASEISERVKSLAEKVVSVM